MKEEAVDTSGLVSVVLGSEFLQQASTTAAAAATSTSTKAVSTSTSNTRYTGVSRTAVVQRRQYHSPVFSLSHNIVNGNSSSNTSNNSKNVMMSPTLYRYANDFQYHHLIPERCISNPEDLQWTDRYGNCPLHIICQKHPNSSTSAITAHRRNSCSSTKSLLLLDAIDAMVRVRPDAVNWPNMATWTPLHFAINTASKERTCHRRAHHYPRIHNENSTSRRQYTEDSNDCNQEESSSSSNSTSSHSNSITNNSNSNCTTDDISLDVSGQVPNQCSNAKTASNRLQNASSRSNKSTTTGNSARWYFISLIVRLIDACPDAVTTRTRSNSGYYSSINAAIMTTPFHMACYGNLEYEILHGMLQIAPTLVIPVTGSAYNYYQKQQHQHHQPCQELFSIRTRNYRKKMNQQNQQQKPDEQRKDLQRHHDDVVIEDGNSETINDNSSTSTSHHRGSDSCGNSEPNEHEINDNNVLLVTDGCTTTSTRNDEQELLLDDAAPYPITGTSTGTISTSTARPSCHRYQRYNNSRKLPQRVEFCSSEHHQQNSPIALLWDSFARYPCTIKKRDMKMELLVMTAYDGICYDKNIITPVGSSSDDTATNNNNIRSKDTKGKKMTNSRNNIYILHAVCAVQCPKEYFTYILEQNVQYLLQYDEYGQTPLHYATNSSLRFGTSGKGGWKSSTNGLYQQFLIESILTLCPRAASLPNCEGRLPLHLALSSTQPLLLGSCCCCCHRQCRRLGGGEEHVIHLEDHDTCGGTSITNNHERRSLMNHCAATQSQNAISKQRGCRFLDYGDDWGETIPPLTWHKGGVRELTYAHIDSLRKPDPQTGLVPFLACAAGTVESSCTSTEDTLQQQPMIVPAGVSDHWLSTIYELLLAAPEMVTGCCEIGPTVSSK